MTGLNPVSIFLERQGIDFSWNKLGIKGMGAMAQGLFASLLIGTIINTIGAQTGLVVLSRIGAFAVGVTGAAMAVSIGAALEAPPFVLYSLVAVGQAA
ncbi:MAG: PTS sugar transporter subunit IIC, partial [Spirochaetaceae bacterium]|nr:PTS sugar transporter subunit IIC [Spirochaetaceae bacterium]